ncbi:MAG TPA: hypothetical protein VIG69_02110 [Candidatus Methylomirabilis sp.]
MPGPGKTVRRPIARMPRNAPGLWKVLAGSKTWPVQSKEVGTAIGVPSAGGPPRATPTRP